MGGITIDPAKCAGYPRPAVAGGSLALATTSSPAGLLLGGAPGFELNAIALPRVGRRVTLVPRRARAVDGRVQVWFARRVGPGRGEASSGLRHDDLTHENPSPS